MECVTGYGYMSLLQLLRNRSVPEVIIPAVSSALGLSSLQSS